MVTRSPKRGDIYWFYPGGTQGGEIQNNRPCLIVSPDSLNINSTVYIMAPMTRGKHPYKFRIPYKMKGTKGTQGHVVLDQLQAVDRSRLSREPQGKVASQTLTKVLETLQEMFTE